MSARAPYSPPTPISDDGEARRHVDAFFDAERRRERRDACILVGIFLAGLTASFAAAFYVFA